jgi:hypothetical protein
MRSTLSAAFVIGILYLGAMPVRAHHAFAAEFDINRPVELTGTVTKVEWINPHSWIHVSVTKSDGTIEVWAIEAGTPNTLLRRGLKKADLPAGMKIRVTGYQAKDGSQRANGSNVSLPDGRNLFLGSTGTGAPPPPSN